MNKEMQLINNSQEARKLVADFEFALAVSTNTNDIDTIEKEIRRNATSISVGEYMNLLSLVERKRKAIIDMMPAPKMYDELDFLFV